MSVELVCCLVWRTGGAYYVARSGRHGGVMPSVGGKPGEVLRTGEGHANLDCLLPENKSLQL